MKTKPGRHGPALHLKARLPRQSVVEVLASIPATEVPDLAEKLSPELYLSVEFEMRGEVLQPAAWTHRLKYHFDGLSKGPSGLEGFSAPFDYVPLGPRGRSGKPLRTGPGTPGWLRYGSIPYILRRAIMISEDASFPFHRGIDLEEVKAAVASSLDRQKPPRGGSTITQQLAKNLFLSRDRTALRKTQEILLSFLLESALSKPQIFELYINLIEWGPGIYGIGAASEYYFGDAPNELSPLEMAYLATVIPSPTRYHQHYVDGRVPPQHRLRVDKLLDRLHRFEQLEVTDWLRAKEAQIKFVDARP